MVCAVNSHNKGVVNSYTAETRFIKESLNILFYYKP